MSNHISFWVKRPAPNIAPTVNILEKELALNPDRLCPEVQPPSNLAPNIMTTPPAKACQVGIAASAVKLATLDIFCNRTVLPAMINMANMIGLVNQLIISQFSSEGLQYILAQVFVHCGHAKRIGCK